MFGDEVIYQAKKSIYYDSGSEDQNRSIIYNTNHTNGQLFTIHAYQNKTQIPVFFCLMKKRTTEMYKNIFDKTFIAIGCRIQKYMSNFETGQINAAQEKFESAELTGRFFHFQSVISF